MELLKKIRQRDRVLGLPGYAVIPVAAELAAESLTYWGTMVVNAGRRHFDMTCAWDALVPVNGWWLFVYFGAFFFWLFGFVALIRESREQCFRVIGGDLICKAICLAFFLILPTTIIQPDVSGPGAGNALLRLLYSLDKPENLFPSIHVYWTWYTCRWLARRKKGGRAGAVLGFVYTFMVFYSTLATRQHVLADIPSGVAVAEIGLFLECRLRPGRMFERLDRRIA